MSRDEFDQVQRDVDKLYLAGEMTKDEYDVAIAGLNALRRELAVKIDTRLADLHAQADQAERQLGHWRTRLHNAVGDRYSRVGRDYGWGKSLAQAMAEARILAEGEGYQATTAREALAGIDAAERELARIQGDIEGLESVYRANPWRRYFLVTNASGHVHRGMTCSTCFPNTQSSWLVELADAPADDMITEFGEKACTVCFPDAPANPSFHGPGRRDREALDAKAAEKAAREAKKAAKTLTEAEQFKDHRGDRITTVAACKQTIRDEIELRNYGGRGAHPWHSDSVVAAKLAAEVLLAREEAHLGTGATQADIDKIIANKTKAEARLWS